MPSIRTFELSMNVLIHPVVVNSGGKLTYMTMHVDIFISRSFSLRKSIGYAMLLFAM